MSPIQPGVIAPPSGLEKEELEFAEDDDIRSDDRGVDNQRSADVQRE